MKKSPRLLRSLVSLLVLLPLLFQAVLVAAVYARAAYLTARGSLRGYLTHTQYFPWLERKLFLSDPYARNTGIGEYLVCLAALVLIAAVVGFACFRAGRRLVRKGYAAGENERTGIPGPSRNFFIRYPGVVIACGYTVLAALVAIWLPPPWGRFSYNVFETAAAALYWSHLPSWFLSGASIWLQVWPFLVPPFFIYLMYAVGMAREFRRMGAARTRWPGRAIFAAALVLCASVFLWRADVLRSSILHFSNDVERVDDTISILSYRPFSTHNRLVKIPAPALVIESKHPRLDGATALLPVYAAAANAIYKNTGPVDEYAGLDAVLNGHSPETAFKPPVLLSTTPKAYENLIDGRVDVIFCAQPSPAQIEAARAKGVEFQLTPIGSDAFVFFVNEANPVDALTTGQVRAIYTKRITNWSEVGGPREKILPFQRPADSGSQTAMEARVMRGTPMAKPLREEWGNSMIGVVLKAAMYRNAPNAIGYSFRFFVTTMSGVKGIKLLKIDGVAPTVETIRDGTYPYANNFYAITTNKTANNPHVRELIAWFLSPQGQKLIEDTGYIPL